MNNSEGFSMNESQTEAIQCKVNSIMMDLFELPQNKITPEANLFQDLGLDSLDAIDLMMKFKDEYDFKVSNQDLMAIRTIGDVYALVEQASKAGATKA